MPIGSCTFVKFVRKIVSHSATWQSLANRNDPICALPMVAKASIMATIACRCFRLFSLKTLPIF